MWFSHLGLQRPPFRKYGIVVDPPNNTGVLPWDHLRASEPGIAIDVTGVGCEENQEIFVDRW